MLFSYEKGELEQKLAIAGFLPPTIPYAPQYLVVDPLNDAEFVVEVVMRGFRVQVQKVYPTTVQE